MLQAATYLFLEQGYEKTTTGQIAAAAGMAQASFFAAFRSKEELLLELTKIMFSSQFQQAEAASNHNPLLVYALETGLQLHITELSEPLRELYVTTYSLPSTSEFVYQNTTKKLMTIFGPYLPEAKENDFYELDIASASVARGFMAHPCDLYFTMERKLRRFYACCFRLYQVPEAEFQPVIEAALQHDLQSDAKSIIAATVRQAEIGFEALTTQEGE